jgi:cytochrome c oxidase subunit 4
MSAGEEARDSRESPDSRPRSRSTAQARKLLLTFLALLALAGTSLGLRFVPTGPYGLAVALAIAVAKGLLVAVVFMEVGVERPSARLTLLVGVTLVAVLLSLLVADVLTRTVAPLEVPAAGTDARPRAG